MAVAFIRELMDRNVDTLEAFAPLALRRLRRSLPCDEAVLATAGPRLLDEVPAYIRPLLDEPTRFDPQAVQRSRTIAARFGMSFIDTEAYTASERDRLPLYADLIRPAGVSSTIQIVLNVNRVATGLVYLVRHGRARPFAQSALVTAAPVIRTISVIHRALMDLRTQASSDVGQVLTDREREVAGLAALGYQVQQIAARLEISTHTVRHHLAAIYRKWRVGSRAELALVMARGVAHGAPPPSALARIAGAAGLRLLE